MRNYYAFWNHGPYDFIFFRSIHFCWCLLPKALTKRENYTEELTRWWNSEIHHTFAYTWLPWVLESIFSNAFRKSHERLPKNQIKAGCDLFFNHTLFRLKNFTSQIWTQLIKWVCFCRGENMYVCMLLYGLGLDLLLWTINPALIINQFSDNIKIENFICNWNNPFNRSDQWFCSSLPFTWVLCWCTASLPILFSKAMRVGGIP